uniref:Uncharacterized protein n=1 Tax=Anguilla anguilla TaxID=7936 RepID=A0A0E9PMF9_ANGAN
MLSLIKIPTASALCSSSAQSGHRVLQSF